MKIFYKLLVSVIFCAIITSCSTSQTISVFGNPGTEIYSPDMDRVGVVDNKGIAKIKIASDDYYAYLMSFNKSTGDFVPFALDYKECNYLDEQVLRGVGYTVMFAGAFAGFVGAIAAIDGSDDVARDFFVPGSAGMLLGAAISMPSYCRLNQIQQTWKYKYLPTHQSNESFTFTYPENSGVNKLSISQIETPAKTLSVEKPSSIEGVSEVRSKTSKSTRNIRNYGKILMGTYIGSGELLQGEAVIESYNNMLVRLKRVDNKTVTVEVIDHEGAPFFSSVSNYSIRKNNNGTYELTLKGIPSAKIKIDKNKKLTYVHPKVSIDDEIYTLKISAIQK